MREIKFRAWYKSAKQMRSVANVSFSAEQITTGDQEYPHRESVLKFSEIDLMQFTGLKDKNGKDIYEGDIVVRSGYIWFDEGKPNYRGTVEWIYSQWQVIAHCVNPEKRGISDGVNEGLNEVGFKEGAKSDWEVIGNIYENSDLLTN